MKFQLFTSSFLTICLIVASGIQVAQAARVTSTWNQQNYIGNVDLDLIPSLDTSDRIEPKFSKMPSKSDVTKINRLSSGNKLQRQNPQQSVITLRCKSPCKTEI